MVPSATVEVINDDTNVTSRVTAGSAGVYNVPNLGIGAYRVRVSRSGFASYERTGLRLSSNQILNLDVLGGTANTVEVQSATPSISTETSDISGSMTYESLQVLPAGGPPRPYCWSSGSAPVGGSEAVRWRTPKAGRRRR